MKYNIITALILILIIGGSIGWRSTAHASTPGAGTVTSNSSRGDTSNQAINEAFNAKSTAVRLTLNSLLREHAAMGAVTLTALYQGNDTTRLMQLMNNNENQLATLVQNAYGQNAKNTFVQLWTQHMQEYQNYTLARKNNDTTKMNTAKQHLQVIANKFGNLFASSGKNLSAVTVSNLMMAHINGTLGIVDAVASGNATQTANLMKAGYDQAGKFADTLTRGMILDNPNKF